MSAAPQKVRIAPQIGPQTVFLSSSADIAIIGGAAGGGKTRALLMEPLRHLKNPEFATVIFRKTNPEINMPGGLWDESQKVYPHMKGKPTQNPYKWRFPTGSRVEMRHLQNDAEAYNWAGGQVALFEWDELTAFNEGPFWFMQSRARSMSGVKPYTRGSCNPDPDSFVAKLISWWIDQETGFAIPERSGVLRYFVRVGDELVFADDAETIGDRYPDQREFVQSLTFVPAKLEDNPALLVADPTYLARLMSLQEVDRERLLRGNWKIRFAKGTMFRYGWLPVKGVDPLSIRMLPHVRFWDEAGTEDGGNWTIGVLLAYDARRDIVYIEDVVRVQEDTADREHTMERTLRADRARYPYLHTVFEHQGGSAGKGAMYFRFQRLKKVEPKRLHSRRPSGSKIERAKPVSIRAEQNVERIDELGNLRPKRDALVLLPGVWNQVYTSILHAFPTSGVPDDDVDATSGGHEYLLLNHEIIARGA